MISKVLKKNLLEVCLENIEERCSALKINLASVEESRNNETKSSVGDKYETGRAMMQLEHQKIESQLNRLQNQRSQLKKIDLNIQSVKVRNGSLVETNQGVYFISIPLGKVSLEGETYFCLSMDSPLGKVLNRKSKGDDFTFNGKQISVIEVV